MPLPVSGPLSVGDIAAEFTGTVPHGLSEYYGAAPGVPTSGPLDVSDFYGKADNKLEGLFAPTDLGDWWATGFSPASAAGTGLRGNVSWNAPQAISTDGGIVGYGNVNNGGTQPERDITLYATDSTIPSNQIITLIECRILRYDSFGFYGKAYNAGGVYTAGVSEALYVQMVGDGNRGLSGKTFTSANANLFYDGAPGAGGTVDNKTVFRQLTIDPTLGATPQVTMRYQVNGGTAVTAITNAVMPAYNVGSGNWLWSLFNTTNNGHRTCITAAAVINRNVSLAEFGEMADWIYNDSSININTGNRS